MDSTPAARTWAVDTSTQSDPVLVGAGDIATCQSSGDEATANLLDGISGTVFTLGDNAYENGSAAEFADCYDPSWGRHKARTRPAVGNHDYQTPGASGYFGYFGAAAGDPAKGYYSYNLGEWHVISLNSMCENVGGCGESSPMVTWLKQDLAANPKACTAAYFHHPLFNSGSEYGNISKMKPSWDALYAAGAEVVLNGHEHVYERFAPQTPAGTADSAQGIREFIVGTGGASHYSFGTIQPNSQVRNADTSGVLKLTLHPGSYDWRFVSEGGKTFTDSGSDQCHGVPGNADTTAPTVSVVPNEGATGVATTANVEATFSEAMDASTISGSTLTLTKQGSTQVLAAQVSYDAVTKKATLNPSTDFDPGTTYTATIKGGSGGVKDLAGNPLGADKTGRLAPAAPPSVADSQPQFCGRCGTLGALAQRQQRHGENAQGRRRRPRPRRPRSLRCAALEPLADTRRGYRQLRHRHAQHLQQPPPRPTAPTSSREHGLRGRSTGTRPPRERRGRRRGPRTTDRGAKIANVRPQRGFVHLHASGLGGAGVAEYADFEQRHPAGRHDQLRRVRLGHQGGDAAAQAHPHLHHSGGGADTTPPTVSGVVPTRGRGMSATADTELAKGWTPPQSLAFHPHQAGRLSAADGPGDRCGDKEGHRCG